MRSGGNDFNDFLENKLTKLANFVQLKRMLMFFFLEDWGAGPLLPLPLWLRRCTCLSVCLLVSLLYCKTWTE